MSTCHKKQVNTSWGTLSIMYATKHFDVLELSAMLLKTSRTPVGLYTWCYSAKIRRLVSNILSIISSSDTFSFRSISDDPFPSLILHSKMIDLLHHHLFLENLP